MLNLNAMFNTSCDVFDTRVGDNEVNNKSLDADYLLNDLSSSLNAISSQFSALMSSHNRISDMYSYIKLYGVDHACVQVYNRDGLLTDLSNGVVPATEDFRESNVSKYTIACMEGLGESIIKIFKWCWEKLKAIGKWIGEKVVAAFNWILSLFKSDKKKEMTMAEAIEELAKVKGEAKAKMDEIVKRFNASSSSNKITGVEDLKNDEPQLDPYVARSEWSSKDKDAHELIVDIRRTIAEVNRSVRFCSRDLKENIKRIDTFTTIIDSYGDAADDDSKFKEAYERAISETENVTQYGHPCQERKDVTENLKKLAAGLKDIASNPLRFKDFDEVKNTFNQYRSLRSQFEDVAAEAKSLAAQSHKQLENACARGNAVIKVLNKAPYSNIIRADQYERAHQIQGIDKLEGLKEEVSRIATNCKAVDSIVKVATGLGGWFKKSMTIYEDTVNRITRQMKNQQQEENK